MTVIKNSTQMTSVDPVKNQAQNLLNMIYSHRTTMFIDLTRGRSDSRISEAICSVKDIEEGDFLANLFHVEIPPVDYSIHSYHKFNDVLFKMRESRTIDNSSVTVPPNVRDFNRRKRNMFLVKLEQKAIIPFCNHVFNSKAVLPIGITTAKDEKLFSEQIDWLVNFPSARTERRKGVISIIS